MFSWSQLAQASSELILIDSAVCIVYVPPVHVCGVGTRTDGYIYLFSIPAEAMQFPIYSYIDTLEQ
jgi:hypothetical protein